MGPKFILDTWQRENPCPCRVSDPS